jgi:hypothetical protein
MAQLEANVMSVMEHIRGCERALRDAMEDDMREDVRQSLLLEAIAHALLARVYQESS